MYIKILFFFTILYFQAWAVIQNELPLSKIIIVGNDHTQNKVIERELLFKHGDLVTDSLLTISKNRLENLWLFNRVEFFPMQNGDSLSLLISITERLYLFPYPEFKVEDRDWDKLTYGIGLAHDNFRGGNEKLYLSAQFGYRPGYKLAYQNPWIGKNLHLTASAFLQKYSVPNRLYNFDENHFYTALSIGKFWTRDFSTRLIFYRDDLRVKTAYAAYLQSTTRRDLIYASLLTMTLDTRDLYAYPRAGYYINLSYQQSGFFNKAIDFAIYRFDLRKYFNIQNLIIASRIYTAQSRGSVPVYNKIFFGFQERVRGHFSEIQSGDHLLFGGLALRYPILKLRYFSMPTVLLPEASTKNMKFGINGGLFAESGIVWSHSSEFMRKNMITGFGFGIHFLLPYIEVLRLDMAFSEELKHEFILEIEMPF